MNRFSLALSTCLLLSGQAAADSDAQYAAVKSLGELNGVALHCRYFEQVKKMKAAVVQNAPKERSFGLAFDQSANDAFLAFIAAATPCPGAAGFELQVAQRIDAMRDAFKTP
jgi:hypothetical protein